MRRPINIERAWSVPICAISSGRAGPAPCSCAPTASSFLKVGKVTAPKTIAAASPNSAQILNESPWPD